MTVDEMLKKLGDAFGLFNSKALAVWAPVYRAALAHHEGPVLAAAFRDMMQAFEPTARRAYPTPRDFVPFLPAPAPKPDENEPKLDFAAHAERFRSLLAEWRRQQGHRASGGRIEILRALETQVEALASVWAWSADPKPILLTRGQVRKAQHCAISQERVHRHGPLPKDGGTWWAQIEAIATEWEITTSWDDWTSRTKEGKAA